ncbi:lytic transglycosylase domain-containing protein [Brucella intermedia]|uniref:lytic transglycosylase domain-containing protein n=1 Tax=Brucella intermedia TaxID=94625 RepID=UPI00224B4DBD|nr:lytic transglycosylase domain-containing protein [Brucella intermedia]
MAASFVDLAQHCAPQIAVETLAAVVSIESNFQPFAIRINSNHPLADQPRTRSEAIETATILVAEGHDVDLGLGGVSAGELNRLGLSVTDTFDFCLNLKATATLLDGYYQVAMRAGATDAAAQSAMLRSYYGRGDASVGEMVGYDEKVLAEMHRLSGLLGKITLTEGQGADAAPSDEAGSANTIRQGSPLDGAAAGSQPRQTSVPAWDVFNSGRRSSVLVFSNEQKE